MRCSVLFVCALALLAVPALAAKDVDVTFQNFMNYVTTFNKRYASIDEFIVRYNNYNASMARAAELQAQDPLATFGETKFADMTYEEFRSTYLGFKPTPRRPGTHRVRKPKNLTDAPTSWNWNTQGAVTAVKDQGACGSCWAFSAVEEIESAVFMATGTLPILSEEQVVDCDTVDAGCDGGDTIYAYQYVEKAGGIESEKDYPYTAGSGKEGKCQVNKAKFAADISDFEYATPPCTNACTKQDEGTLRDNLYSSGPVSICVDATDAWMTYKSGILSKSCPAAYSSLNHCVQLVGYDLSSATGYWIVRNSWNTDWGEKGYIRLGYGSNACGLADEATVVVVA